MSLASALMFTEWNNVSKEVSDMNGKVIVTVFTVINIIIVVISLGQTFIVLVVFIIKMSRLI